MTVKVKYGDVQTITRSRTQPSVINTQAALRHSSLALIRSVLPTEKGIRLVEVTVSNSDRAPVGDEVLPLFVDAPEV